MVEKFLHRKKGFFSIPQKGESKKLIDLSQENAEYYLEDFLSQRNLNESDLEEIKEFLNLKNLPRTIECLDISNIQETATVASMVCFKGLKPSKKTIKSTISKDVVISLMTMTVFEKLSLGDLNEQ